MRKVEETKHHNNNTKNNNNAFIIIISNNIDIRKQQPLSTLLFKVILVYGQEGGILSRVYNNFSTMKWT